MRRAHLAAREVALRMVQFLRGVEKSFHGYLTFVGRRAAVWV